MSRKLHPIAEAALGAAQKVGHKAVRRALESLGEDAEDAAREVHRRAARFHDQLREEPFQVRVVEPNEEQQEENDMGRKQRRKRSAREDFQDDDRDRDSREEEDEDEEEEDEEEGDDDEESEDQEDLRDADTLLRHAWMLLADLAAKGKYPRDKSRQLEKLVEDLGDRLDD